MALSTIKIDNADFVITMDPLRRIIRGGGVLIEGTRITQVGTAADLAGVTADRIIDGRGMVVTPGLVNGHDHLFPQLMRGMFADELSKSYVEESCAVRSGMNEDEEYLGVLACLTEHLINGTTTVLNPGDSRRPDCALQAYEICGARVVTGFNVTDQPNDALVPQMPTEEALKALQGVIDAYAGRCDGRVSAWVMLTYATIDCTRRFAVAAKRLADENGVGMSFHQSARQRHVDRCLADHGMRPVAYLRELGIVGPNVVLAHGVLLDDAEIDILAETQTRVVMCPTASLRAGFGTTRHGRLPEMLARGVVVGLGTDSADFSTVDLTRAMFLAAGLYKDAREDTAMIPAETALEMATIMGARAIGLDHEIGSLEPGKKADLAIYDARRSEWRPLFNPVQALVYQADGRSVHTVIVDGVIRVENGVPTFLDQAKLAGDIQAAAERMVARTGHDIRQRWPMAR